MWGCRSVWPSQPCLCNISVQLGLLEKPLSAFILKCMPLTNISKKPHLHSQFFKKPVRLQKELESLSLAEITSLLDRNIRLTGGVSLWALCLWGLP